MVRAGAFWTRDFDNRALRSCGESDDERAAGWLRSREFRRAGVQMRSTYLLARHCCSTASVTDT